MCDGEPWLQVATRRLGVTTNYGTYIASLQQATVTVMLAKCIILAAEKGSARDDANFLEDSQARCASVLRGLARTVCVYRRNEMARPGSARGLLGGLGGLLKSSLWGEETWKLPGDLLPVCSEKPHFHFTPEVLHSSMHERTSALFVASWCQRISDHVAGASH
jgi:hypothetical protein